MWCKPDNTISSVTLNSVTNVWSFLLQKKQGDVLMVLQSQCVTLEGVDEEHEFARLKQSMEMVGFSPETQRK